MVDSPWTEDKIAYLRRYWKNGRSASDIGKHINMSRGAVIGKARRLAMACPADSPIKRAAAANCNRPRRAKPRPPREAFSIAMIDLGHDDCRFPQGDRPAAMRFCGAPCRPGSSYCNTHHDLCWEDPPTRAASAHRQRPKPGRLTLTMPT